MGVNPPETSEISSLSDEIAFLSFRSSGSQRKSNDPFFLHTLYIGSKKVAHVVMGEGKRDQPTLVSVRTVSTWMDLQTAWMAQLGRGQVG